MMYSLNYPYTTLEERDDIPAEYKALVEAVLIEFKTKTVTTKGLKAIFYSCKNEAQQQIFFASAARKNLAGQYIHRKIIRRSFFAPFVKGYKFLNRNTLNIN